MPRTIEPLTGANELRKAVRLMDQCREDFLDRYTAEQLLMLYRALRRSEWDILPDQWTSQEIKLALAGKGTGATSER